MEFRLGEWELVVTNGLRLVGKTGAGRKLTHVFEIHTSLIQDQENGRLMQPLLLLPFLGLGLISLEVPEGAVRISLSNFSDHSKNWEALIRKALEQETRLRAAGVGLVLPQ